MNAIKIFFLICLFFLPKGYANNGDDARPFNYLTMYFVDNSDGSNANALNNEMVEQLKENLKKLSNRPDNYFYFYGCNGQEQLTSDNLSNFADAPKLKKYLKSPSKESEYSFDKKAIRDHFTEYPVKIKQNIEINIYLSAYAAKRITKEIETLPSPVFFPNELPIYLNISNLKEVNIKIFIFINQEVRDEIGEEKLNKYFNFCNGNLNLEKVQTQIKYL